MRLEDARQEMDAKVLRGKGTRCPCCDQYVQIYKRSLNAGMVRFLVHVVQKGWTDWFHINRDFPDHRRMCGGDYAKLAFFGLLEAMPENLDSKKKSSGFWRVTDKGRQFVNGDIAVPSYVKLLHNKVQEVSVKQTTVMEALQKGGFDYSELMQNAA